MDRLAVLVIALLVFSGKASAQGIIIGPDARPAQLQLSTHQVEALIEEQVAVVTVTHTFLNPGKQTVEGTFLFPLPPEAQVSHFTMEADGKEMAGELLTAEEARKIYEDIVRRSLDPALLEMADYRTFRARVFPVPAGASRTITLRYDATLPLESNTVAFRHPLQGALATRGTMMPAPPMPRREGGETEQESAKISTRSTIRVELASGAGLRNIYSPSHEIEVDQQHDRRAVVTLENRDGLDGRDFILYYSLVPDEIGATLLAHRPYRDKDGYFLLLLSPPVETDAARIQPQDIVFVLDTSGSMAGEKMEQARDALRHCLERLREEDRFGIVAFSSDVDAFRDGLSPTTAREEARYYVDRLEARGGTNINEALLKAVDLLKDSRRGMIIFLTDGLPSTGVTEEGAIRNNIQRANERHLRLFSFGVGYDVNTRLLDGLSREASAFAAYISPDENIERRVSHFYEQVRHPVLTDLRFSLEGIEAHAFAPGNLPDLYKGGQLLLAGRYRKPGPATLTLTGQRGDRTDRRTYSFRFPEAERERDFVARLWATRRVGLLLDEVRLQGENRELKDEIIALAKEFGLVTPYTSYLVQEEEMPQAADAAQRQGFAPVRGVPMAAAAPAEAARIMNQTTGAEAVTMSKAIRAMQEAEVASNQMESGLIVVQGRTLQRTPEGWVDLDYQEGDKESVQIAFASDAYFTLLRLYPELSGFARLGNNVTFRFKERFIRIGKEGKAMSEAELRALFG